MKRFLAVILTVIISISFLINITPVSADGTDYTTRTGFTDQQGGTYYVANADDFNKLFSFTLDDVDDILKWIFNFKTFIVLKDYYDKTSGRQIIKGYWNTPNLQTLAKNLVISNIDDGYTEETYDVNETEWLVSVGKHADKINAITKYGFRLPNYTYFGEYPKEFMSIQNIVPSGFWETLWRAILTLFGFSFISPPDGRNFSTITYRNHQYNDNDEELIYFIQDNFIPYFYYQNLMYWESSDDNPLIGTFFENRWIKDNSGNYYLDRGATHFLELYISWDQFNAIQNNYARMSVTYDLDYLKSILFKNDNSHYYINTAEFDSSIIEKGYGDCSYGLTICGLPMFDTAWWAGSAGATVLMPDATAVQTYINSILYNESENSSIQVPNTYAAWLSLYLKQVINQYNNKKYQFNYLYHFDNKAYPRYLVDYQQFYNGDTEFTTAINEYFKQQTDSSNKPNFSDQLYYYNTLNLSKKRDDPNTEDIDESLEYNYDDHYLAEWYYTSSTWDRKAEHINAPEIPYILNVDATVVDPTKNEELGNLLSNYITWMKAARQIVNFQKHFNARVNQSVRTPLLGIKLGENVDRRWLFYSQCMITNKGDDNECWSDEYSDSKVTISWADIWVSSGLYKAINYSKYQNYSNRYLSREDAITVLNTIKNFTGPYFADVMDKMVDLVYTMEDECEETCIITRDHSWYVKKRKFDDYRVMPYDVNSMTDADKSNVTVVDPRVKLYTDTFVGGLVAEFTFRLNLGVYIKIQPVIVNLAGKLTEFSVFFQQLINFDTFDNWGLSPASMWQNAFVTLVMIALALLFIIKTASIAIKYALGGNGSIIKVISMFLILAIELGLFTAISLNPERTWTVLKTNITRAMNLGEQLTLNDDELQYLFGTGDDRDPAAAYYIPYLDAWSMYNTGYGLLARQQLITNTPAMDTDASDGYANDEIRERWGLNDSGTEANWPKVGNNKIEHWSILLLDSFEYHGDNYSLKSVKDEDGRWVNGKRINNNAYRVVDHFLAPRISLTKSSDKIILTTTQNENYNGQFQSGFTNLLTKLLNVILILCLSILKFLIFIWLWYQIYIFIFKVILARMTEKKSWPDILIETFSPILGMIGIGAWVGICIKINAYLNGIVGLLVEIGLFIVTGIVIRWWSTKPKVFPKTLVPIAALLNIKQTKRNYNTRKSEIESENEAKRYGDTDEHDMSNADADRQYYFDDDKQYQIKDKFRKPERIKAIEQWINRVRLRAQSGETISDKDKNALMSYMKYTNQEGKYDFTTFERNKEYAQGRKPRRQKETEEKIKNPSNNN